MNDFLPAALLEKVSPSHSQAIPYYREVGQECQLFEFAFQRGLPLLIKGPTGCGKTRFVAHMAARLERPLITVACHDDLSAADLVGRHLIGDGETIWSDGPLTRSVREGGICYLDEIVEARKDTTVVLHPLTDDRRVLPIERTGELLQAPSEFMLVASYNPGYQNLLKNLKPSTRQRFVAIEFSYPQAEIETDIIVQESGIDRACAQTLVAIAQAFRRLQHYHLEESASTRLLIYAAKLMLAGLTPRAACHFALAQPLSDEASTIAALLEVIHLHFAS
ncbi:CbbQ/NirQ/NorQ/GpvN family protein [Undibacterium cyanobacteriorum]|uniref:CbbQ/NirQ/NorQ/GpvN family protein n=1 Tax=Undibacterium cyanobacteriorum TaxID=3073561 RepID=A0ABY9RG88_9BURK|nr:CbbQ/NirQ/NorQ/GpvN family protein [Undibacterium sp. 20NA77.5]WMW80234.1 CbbQ/NirQ/NorQ/GpvN family protein [Undibacterium sp. 20NA77.5]